MASQQHCTKAARQDKGTVSPDAFGSNITFPSPTSSHSFHLLSPQQPTKWGPLHCTGLIQANHCLRVRLPNFTSSGAAFLADRNYRGPREHRMSADAEPGANGKDTKPIMPAYSHSQPPLSRRRPCPLLRKARFQIFFPDKVISTLLTH